MLEEITHENTVYAIVIKKLYKSDGIKFFTENNSPQQIGYMNRKQGYKVIPHIHKEAKRMINKTCEVLFIKTGRVRVDFYTFEKTYLTSRILEEGDIILLSEGGHGLKMLEDSEIIEVKQGPYIEDQDKERFKSDLSEKIINYSE